MLKFRVESGTLLLLPSKYGTMVFIKSTYISNKQLWVTHTDYSLLKLLFCRVSCAREKLST